MKHLKYWTLAFMAAAILGAQPSSAAFAATPPASPPSGGDTVAPDFASLVTALKGRWETLVYHEEIQGGVAPHEAPDHGEQVWRTGPGGLTLMEEEHIASRGADLYVLALHWWDRSTNTLKGMLCNNAGSGACSVDSFYRSKLNWDGKRLTVDLVFPQGAKLMLWHEEFGDFTGTSFTQTGDMGEVGGPLKRVMTIRARKVSELN